jgi:hypothetical protein
MRKSKQAVSRSKANSQTISWKLEVMNCLANVIFMKEAKGHYQKI